jgi:hypothetical protein
VSSVSVILVYTLLALGAVTGLVCLRNQVVQELGDLGVAIDHLDQSFSVDWDGDGTIDASFSDPGPTLLDTSGSPPAGIAIDDPALTESSGGSKSTIGNQPGEEI